MEINRLEIFRICTVLLMSWGVLGCQPQSSSVATPEQTDQDVQIEARTIPVKGAVKVVWAAYALICRR